MLTRQAAAHFPNMTRTMRPSQGHEQVEVCVGFYFSFQVEAEDKFWDLYVVVLKNDAVVRVRAGGRVGGSGGT